VKKIILIICVCIILCAIVPIHKYMKKERPVPFEFIGCLEERGSALGGRVWSRIEGPNGTECTRDNLRRYCDIDDIEMDFEEYTYIVVEGYSIKSMTYNYVDVWGRFSGYMRFNPRVELVDEGHPEMLYFYRIKEEYHIRNDYHWPGFNPRTILVK